MVQAQKNKDDISIYIEDQEFIANTYVLKSFSVTMLLYTIVFILNLLGIFIVDERLMYQSFIPSLCIYLLTVFMTHKVSRSDPKVKYFILFCEVLVYTVIGVSITYHALLLTMLPFLYATLYSSKKMMYYVCVLTVTSTIIIVYGGYYFGLCDANMALLTSTTLQSYMQDGQFTLTTVNPNPKLNLMLFFVLPRCMIYITFMFVCRSIFVIVSGSVEKARLTADLEKAKIEAENANRAKSRFLAKMSHEIRTPINAILGMNEMIIRESNQEPILEYAQDVKDSSELLLNLINEILDSAKVESGVVEIVEEKYGLASLLNDLHNMIQIRAKEKNLELIFDVNGNIPGAYIGDEKRIKQVLLNILTNAVKYTEHGSVTFKVDATVAEDRATLHFAVKDTGIGIRKENLSKIYEDFMRFDPTKNKNVEGTGLGMSISRQFLKLMGSELQIESEYGVGSVFSFDLEQEIAEKAPLGNFKERLRQAQDKKEERILYTAPLAKVLVVDDNRMNLKVFSKLLRQTEIQVYEADSGKACLEMLKKNSFHMVFLDHMMPEMDGIETFRIIKEERLCEGVPIVMFTANALVDDRAKYLQEGFDDVLSKPILPGHLDAVILKLLPEDLLEKQVEKENQPMESGITALIKKLPELDIKTGLATSSGDENFYMELLKDFTEMPIKQELEQCMESQDYKNYCIRIHAFKGSAYSVGAKEIGDLAYEMEKLTRESIPAEIPDMQQHLYEMYDRVCSRFQELVSRK